MYIHALTSIIQWKLWRKRNNIKHEGKEVNGQRLIFNITRNFRMLHILRKSKLEFSYKCPGIQKDFEQLKTKVRVTKVLWKFPVEGWVMHKLNGASRGNSRASSYAFYLRDMYGYLIYAKCAIIQDRNNMDEQTIAIL